MIARHQADLPKLDREPGFKNYMVVVFIYISVFINSFVFFKEPFEFYLGYLIFLLLLPGFIFRHGIHRNLFFLFLILFVTGLLNILTGDNTPQQFFKVFTGLMLSYFFYHYVILHFDYDVDKLFRWYLKGCYIVAWIGLIQFFSYLINFRPGFDYTWIFNKWGVVGGGNFGIRINSVFGEPTYLGAVLSSAFFVSLWNLFSKKAYYLTKFQGLVIIVVYILSFSGLGQVGILLSMVFLAISLGLLRYFIIIIPLAVIIVTFMYNNIREFRERYDSLVDLFTTEKFVLGKTHGSSFILFNNYKVATENFKSNFLFGTGVGSHPVAFGKYSIAKDIKVYGFNLNSADANSMLLRLISETGIFGVGLMFFILFKFFVRRDQSRDSYHWIISNSILIMILLNLFRQGHYFLNGFPFFVLLYIYNYFSYQKYIEETSSVHPSPEPETSALATD